MHTTDTHIDILTAVVLRRGWASGSQVRETRSALPGGATVNDLLDLLVGRSVIDRSQARELRLDGKDLQEIDRYRILCRLGSGAMGTVYLGEDRESGDQVALKVISTSHVDDQEFISRFNREVDLVARLDHPHIARSLGMGRIADERVYLALEYVNGPSLADLLRAHGALPQDYVLRVAGQVASGLEHAFTTSGLVHRDIKPENILMAKRDGALSDIPDSDDQAKIIDFGLAKTVNSDQSLTMTGLTMGTPHYMSPEQICGKKDLDCRTDIYGLACTCYHLLTRHTPFRGDSPGGIMMAHINDPVPDPGALVPSLHAATRELLIMAMAKEREERFLSFQGFRQACEQALEAIGSSQAGGVRLLRKPLVVNKPSARRQEGSDRHRKELSSRTYRTNDPPSGPRLRDATSRIIAKHQHQHGGGAETPAHTLPALELRTEAGQAEEALRRVQTDSIRRRILGDRPPPPTALQKDDHRAGPGLLPWLVLALALALLVWVLLP